MEAFRTIEISDSRFENDGLRYITVKSQHLKGRGDICVFIPPGLEELTDCPLVILLHGVYGSAWSWSLSGGVHLTAGKMIQNNTIPPMVIAMPSDGLWGDGSGYVPHDGLDFEKWIAEDVPEALKRSVPLVGNRSPIFIGGLSMGGFGALKIGVKYHNLFSAIAVHSSITNLKQMELFVEEDLQNYAQKDKADEDVFDTILTYRDVLPAIQMDCGIDDPLLQYNRTLHQQLSVHNIDHVYNEYPGGHQWTYWEKHVADSLLFFSRYIRQPEK